MIALDAFAESKGFTGNELRAFGVRDGLDRIEVPYKLRDGSEYARLRVRYDDRGFAWSRGSLPVIPYGLDRPVPYSKKHLLIVEGESDCWALWLADVPALGLPGATSTACLLAEHLDGVTDVGVIREPDAAGARFPLRVANRLREVGFTGAVSALSFAPSKDARDARNVDPAGFAAKVRAVWKTRVPVEPVVRVIGPPVLSVGDVFARGHERIEYRIGGLLPCGGSLLLGAQKKVGKSVLLLNAAVAVARGVRFLDRETTQTRVLYLSLDEPESITHARMRALGFRAEDAVDFFFDPRAVPGDWEGWLRGLCVRGKYGLLIVDTLAKLTGVRDINEYTEWNRALAPLKALQNEFTLAWIGSAHNRKDSAGGSNAVAGSMAVLAGVDTILVEQRLPGGVRTLESEQRFGVDLESTVLGMDAETFALRLGDEQWLARRKEIEGKIVLLMGDGAVRTGKDIFRDIRVKWADGYAALDVLLATGVLVKRLGKFMLAPEAFAAPPGTSSAPLGTSAPMDTLGTFELPAPSAPSAPCGFFTGHPGDPVCQRCGLPWIAHLGAGPATAAD